MIELETEQQTIEMTAFALGITEAEARELIAIERGQIDGDIVTDAVE